MMPAGLEQTEIEFKFNCKMGIKASVGWEKGVYLGASVEGKVQLVRII